MRDAILIVMSSPEQATVLRANLETEFTIHSASTEDDVLALALKHQPKVILMDMRLSWGSGLDVLTKLRQYPRTAHIPLMFIVEGTDALMKPNFLQAGAYDVLEKPLDLAELGLRIQTVKGHSVHPVTHLPTGALIETFKAGMRSPYAQIILHINGFETFKDLNGFVTANEVLTFTGTVLTEVINLLGSPEDVAGHLADDDFILITSPSRMQAFADYLSERLGEQLPQFHSFIERDQGYIEAEDGAHKPLMSLEITCSVV